MSNNRKALVANGLLVFAASLSAILDASGTSSDWGRWITYGMGVSLIYSGAMDFCGFALIFEHLQTLNGRRPERS